MAVTWFTQPRYEPALSECRDGETRRTLKKTGKVCVGPQVLLFLCSILHESQQNNLQVSSIDRTMPATEKASAPARPVDVSHSKHGNSMLSKGLCGLKKMDLCQGRRASFITQDSSQSASRSMLLDRRLSPSSSHSRKAVPIMQPLLLRFVNTYIYHGSPSHRPHWLQSAAQKSQNIFQ